MNIPDNVAGLLEKEHFVIVSSLYKKRSIRTSAKGVIKVDPKGKIFILDLYKGGTYINIKRNPAVTLTVISERSFSGYSIEGKAKIIKKESVSKSDLKLWEEKIAKRIARRIISHVKEERAEHEAIPEASFPLPKHLIEVSVDRIIDLAPRKIKIKIKQRR